MKTTNAKTKAFQTPAAPEADPGKTNQKSVSARKTKPRVSHAEMTKLERLGGKDELEEREIEYMPPKPKGEVIALGGNVTLLMHSRSTRLSRRPSPS